MSDLIKMGVPIELDTRIINENGIKKEVYIERELIFNYNVIKKLKDKFGSIDDVLNSISDDNIIWIAKQMLDEHAKIHNKKYPDDPIPSLSEDEIGMYITGISGLNNLILKVNEAMLLGLPPEQVQVVEAIEKNLMTTQSQDMDGKTKSLLQRFLKKVEK